LQSVRHRGARASRGRARRESQDEGPHEGTQSQARDRLGRRSARLAPRVPRAQSPTADGGEAGCGALNSAAPSLTPSASTLRIFGGRASGPCGCTQGVELERPVALAIALEVGDELSIVVPSAERI